MIIEEQFFRHVSTSKEGCWEWCSWRDKDGYGEFKENKKKFRAHRWSYERFIGPVGGLLVLHSCDNAGCVRPSHLFLGTQQDNMRDMQKKGRHRNTMKTHCKYGHEFTPENSRYRLNNGKRNGRVCVKCTLEYSSRRKKL